MQIEAIKKRSLYHYSIQYCKVFVSHESSPLLFFVIGYFTYLKHDKINALLFPYVLKGLTNEKFHLHYCMHLHFSFYIM